MSAPFPDDKQHTDLLEIGRFQDEEGVVLELHGQLDLSSTAELERQLTTLVAEPPGRILIDLRNLDFMDSTGLAMLVRARQAAEEHGHKLCLRAGNHHVHRLFELTGLTDAFTFISDDG
jgi:anti-sigma B factor antagonist